MKPLKTQMEEKMKLSEMIKRTKELLDKDTADAAFEKALVNGINTAYLIIARDKWRPVMREEVTIENGTVKIKDLTKNFVSLKSAYTSCGFRLGAWAGKDAVHFPPWATKAEIEYFYLPAPLSGDNDEPDIPEAAVDVYAYIYFAAARYYSIKGQHAEASVWDTRYKNIVDNIREMQGCAIMHTERWV